MRSSWAKKENWLLEREPDIKIIVTFIKSLFQTKPNSFISGLENYEATTRAITSVLLKKSFKQRLPTPDKLLRKVTTAINCIALTPEQQPDRPFRVSMPYYKRFQPA